MGATTETILTDIAPDIYRISTYVPEAGPHGFTFNQFLVVAEEPLLFHTGLRSDIRKCLQGYRGHYARFKTALDV
ncbi:MAG: hypothetical protein DLM50_03605 [Candidatus Meridianibacter frigidus]|nr:MAG: hypothetical protein DLM50_03605 [Candidatus Eremiobacteraeota bacterium]